MSVIIQEDYQSCSCESIYNDVDVLSVYVTCTVYCHSLLFIYCYMFFRYNMSYVSGLWPFVVNKSYNF